MSNSTAAKIIPIEHSGEFARRKVAQADGAGLTREAKRTLLLTETLPQGITIGRRSDGREKPWFVRFGSKRVVESFVDERSRNDRAQELADGVRKQGTGVLDFDPAEWRKLLDFREATGVSLDEAREIVLRVRGNVRVNLTVAEAAEKYLAIR